MREILFRGKSVDTGEWVEGDLLQYRVLPVIFDKDLEQHECLGNTVGQFTGLTDKNGKRIFEGDVCRGRNDYELGAVICRDGVYMLDCFSGHKPALWEIMPIKTIGNIYENPELMEETKNEMPLYGISQNS